MLIIVSHILFASPLALFTSVILITLSEVSRINTRKYFVVYLWTFWLINVEQAFNILFHLSYPLFYVFIFMPCTHSLKSCVCICGTSLHSTSLLLASWWHQSTQALDFNYLQGVVFTSWIMVVKASFPAAQRPACFTHNLMTLSVANCMWRVQHLGWFINESCFFFFLVCLWPLFWTSAIAGWTGIKLISSLSVLYLFKILTLWNVNLESEHFVSILPF